MVIKSEKKSKKKPGKQLKSHKPGRPRYYIPHQNLDNNWLPIPFEKYPDFLAEIDAAAKDRREGKPIDKHRFHKYFLPEGDTEGKNTKGKKKKLNKIRLRKNWKEIVNKVELKRPARPKPNSSRKKKNKK